MNNHLLAPGPRWSLAAAAFLLFVFIPSQSLGSLVLPAITSVRTDGKAIVVSVSVPNGVRKVTLESRSRLGAGSWVPRAVSRLDGNGGDLTFQLPKSAEAEILRVRADDAEPLPSSFYTGTNEFVGGISSSVANREGVPVADALPGAAAPGADGGGSTREVVESDIWKINGNTLYFFNQYRGLQVIDLTTPDSPVITGTYSLPAAGEQMYVLEGNYVVLLAQDNCSSANGGGSQVLVLDVSAGVPKLAASLPIPGWIQESRLVGSALYVASQAYQPIDGSKGSSWEWGSTVSSFDLSLPGKSAVKDTLWYTGYGNVINATDRFLFIAIQSTDSWWQSILHCIDISAPDGVMKPLSDIRLSGRVPDKFKINQNGDVLSVISENWNTGGAGVFTTLETFSFSNPAAPQKLGRLQFPQREQLHATRFDGDRVYIVTFFRIDPLWIVDLSDPTTPRIAGELEVPGWSTYIQPLGNRLVAIGISDTNDWRVAVSLFDVQDPAKPALLSKVPLGVNNSWSEASNDEKAFAVLPDAGLILVPYQGYETNGYASRVQLIDLASDSLKARGTIEHSFQPRRATLHNDRIYSVSGKQLLTVDAANRDQPAIRSDLELSWSVNQVFAAGDYVLEIANGDNWYGWWSQSAATPPSVRVVRKTDPDRPLNVVVLPDNLSVVGATLQDGKLYLVQGVAGGVYPAVADASGEQPPAQANPPTLFLTVIDATNLPKLDIVGKAQAVTDPLGWSPSLQAVWPRPGVLVWSGGSGGFIPFLDVVSGGGIGGPIGIWRPWWGGNGGRLFAFDVSAPSSPSFASEVNLTTNAWWSFSSPYTANGMVFISHETSEFLEGVTVPGQPAPAPVITEDKTTGVLVTNVPPIGTWVQRYYLDVVDYADAKSPAIRKPVSIPGQLNGLSHGGALLYTVAAHWTNWVTDWNQWLDASAYDGVSASLVSSLALPVDWPHPLLVNNESLFIGRPDSAANTSQLATWTVADSGNFVQTGALQLGKVVNNLAAFGKLLVAQMNDSSTVLLDATNPSVLTPVGKGQPQDCLWYDLSRADGALGQGLWLPLGDYGISVIEANP